MIAKDASNILVAKLRAHLTKRIALFNVGSMSSA